MPRHIYIPNKETEFFRIPVENIVYVESDGNYSNLFTKNGNKTLLSLKLGEIEDLIYEQFEEESHLARIGKRLIVNIDYVFRVNIAKQELILSDGAVVEHKLSASKDALQQLKAFLERKLTKK